MLGAAPSAAVIRREERLPLWLNVRYWHSADIPNHQGSTCIRRAKQTPQPIDSLVRERTFCRQSNHCRRIASAGRANGGASGEAKINQCGVSTTDTRNLIDLTNRQLPLPRRRHKILRRCTILYRPKERGHAIAPRASHLLAGEIQSRFGRRLRRCPLSILQR